MSSLPDSSENRKETDQDFRRFPDEDKIEKVLDKLHALAWDNKVVSDQEFRTLTDELTWVFGIWNKALGSTKLSEVVKPYLQGTPSTQEELTRGLRSLDLLICFFHHYIYAFEEFMNRKFRHSVIRCGLICERIVKRLAVASNNRDVLKDSNFENRANALKRILGERVLDMDFLMESARYIYSRRSRMGAHDTMAPTVTIAQTCISQTPNMYMLYLGALDSIGFPIKESAELLALVGSTIRTSTTMILSQEGKTVSAEDAIESLYRQQYFSMERGQGDIAQRLGEVGYVFPRETLRDTLKRVARRGNYLTRTGNGYIQRLPPHVYYQSEVSD